VTAGASTPESLVQATLESLLAHGFARIEQLETAEEKVVFPLPRGLRDQP
jgi:4-hydroxy-3-methylbut-2-enyl diphosphate reductase